MTMTKEDRLYSMRMVELAAEAEKLGIKIDKKGSKAKAVEKILAVLAEEETTAPEAQETAPEAQEETTEAQQETEKKERKKRAPKAVSTDVTTLLEFITDMWTAIGGTVKYKDGMKFAPLCSTADRQVVKMMWTTKKVSLFTRVESVTEYAETWQKINYGLPFQCIFYNDTEETRNNIQKLLAEVMETDAIRKRKADKETE